MASINWDQLEELPRAATSSAIVVRILELVDSGNFGQGAQMPPERHLATQLGVSRATVREAIHELTLKGIVRRRQGSGTLLLDASTAASSLLRDMSQAEREAAEVIDFRNTFEPEIASLAAQRRTESDLFLLADQCDFDPAQATPEESLVRDRHFHEGLASATHNRLIRALSRSASDWVGAFRSQSHSTPQGRATSLEGHQKILAAVRDRQPERAASFMLEHVVDVGRI